MHGSTVTVKEIYQKVMTSTRRKIMTGLAFSLIFVLVYYITTSSNGITQWPLLNQMNFRQETSKKTKTRHVAKLCDQKTTVITQPCLCYVDTVNGSIGDLILSLEENGIVSNHSSMKCAMTFSEGGRMGNNMGEYATLFALSRINNRPALMTPEMAKMLRHYFKVTMPAMSEKLYSSIKWTEVWIHDWMEESYRHIKGLFVRLNSNPNSWTFYNHLEAEIKKEFTLHDEIQLKAQHFLKQLIGNRSSVTLVGVHVRRGDYIDLMKYHYHGVMAERDFFVKATAFFRSRYPGAIFVVVSNGMDWCKGNIPNDLGDVYFVGNSVESDPISDFAILVNCNHTIFTIGTFGYWAAYLTGGEVVYLTNFTMPDSTWTTFFHYNQEFPPRWHPIAADLSPLYNLTTAKTLKVSAPIQVTSTQSMPPDIEIMFPTARTMLPTIHTTLPIAETTVPSTETTLPTTQTTLPTTQTTLPTTQTTLPTTQTPLPTTQTTFPTTQTPLPHKLTQPTQTPLPTTETTLPIAQTELPTTEMLTTHIMSPTTQTMLPTTYSGFLGPKLMVARVKRGP